MTSSNHLKILEILLLCEYSCLTSIKHFLMLLITKMMWDGLNDFSKSFAHAQKPGQQLRCLVLNNNKRPQYLV